MNSKRYFTLLSLLLMVFISGGFMRSEKLDFTTEVIQIADDRIDIEVTILSGEPEFIFSLWDGEPWENGREIETSEKVSSTEFTFRNLEIKPYVMVVSDNTGLKRVKQIEIQTTPQIQTGRPGY